MHPAVRAAGGRIRDASGHIEAVARRDYAPLHPGVDMQNYNNYTTLDRSIPTISNVDTFADMKHYYSLVKSMGAALQVRRLAQPACH
jgi:hypothetical protein